MFYQLKTLFLLGILNGLLLVIGHLTLGKSGYFVALAIAAVINLIVYYYSDTLVLKAFNAQKMPEEKYGLIYEMVQELTSAANLPMPKLWIINSDIANAFATGRNPQNSSIAITTGILKVLNKDELRGVLAHEISHIGNRDILVTTVAAVLVAALSYMIDIYRWRMFWGREGREKQSSLPFYLLVVILTPILSLLLQLALSRTREYLADEAGAKLSHAPLDLASALQKIEAYAESGHYLSNEEDYSKKAMASLFFCSPFKGVGRWLAFLFSTHPPTKERVKRLSNMKI